MWSWPNTPCPESEADVTYFRTLYQRAVMALDRYPTHIAADAAYDFWYVYETVAHRDGIAAVPLNSHGHEEVRDPDGTPYCTQSLRMHPVFFFQHTNGYRAQRFRCPLLFPQRTSQTCDHAQFAKGRGCVKDLNWEKGGLMRALLDRHSALYRTVYNRRTACERINSHAKALGIEEPKVRNGRSVRNLNTLTYLLINVRALRTRLRPRRKSRSPETCIGVVVSCSTSCGVQLPVRAVIASVA